MSLVFRVFSFTFVVTMLRYYAIILYAFLIFIAICMGAHWNKDKNNFVVKGFKSLLFVGKVTEFHRPFKFSFSLRNL